MYHVHNFQNSIINSVDRDQLASDEDYRFDADLHPCCLYTKTEIFSENKKKEVLL